jgi:hypothetical protein
MFELEQAINERHSIRMFPAATVVVWLVTALATLLLPMPLLRKKTKT